MTTKPDVFSRSAPPIARAERDGESPSTWAIATENYVPQDGWVLVARGGRMRTEPLLPALYDHGRRDEVPFPVGGWRNLRSQGNDVLADVQWADAENPQAGVVRKLAEAGYLRTSIRFRVVKWHAPDHQERARYGIPGDDPMAGVADEWLAMEASFVAVPADEKAGPRDLEEAITRGVVTTEELQALETSGARGPDLELAAALAASAAVREALPGIAKVIQEAIATQTERLVEVLGQLAGTARSPQAPGTGSGKAADRVGGAPESGGDQQAAQQGRQLYDLNALGMATANALREIQGLAPTDEKPDGPERQGRDGDAGADPV